MVYQINPAQKELLKAIGGNVNFKGDDNDFSCYLSGFATRLFISGDIDTAYKCWINDPMACFGVSRESWEGHMAAQVSQHIENEAAMKQHSRCMAMAN
jgi:hypothetical protein